MHEPRAVTQFVGKNVKLITKILAMILRVIIKNVEINVTEVLLFEILPFIVNVLLHNFSGILMP